jgi:hypothetical protein
MYIVTIINVAEFSIEELLMRHITTATKELEN